MKKRVYDDHIEDAHLLYCRDAIDTQAGISEAPKDMPTDEKFRIIGQYTPRIDGKKIVTGRAPYTHDIKLKGMLVGKILRSPHAKAEILSIDLSKAQSLPGVKAAISLHSGKVSYTGDQVAAVAALDEKTAAKALKLIQVDYKPLPAVVTEKSAMEEGAPPVYPDRPNVQQFNEYFRGDVEAGFSQADVIFEKTYKTAVEIHHTTESHASIAWWKGEHLTVWDSTQAVHNVRDGLARFLEIPASRIKVIKTYMGGGFGSKLGLNYHTVAAVLLAKAADSSVKIVLSRKDNSLCVGNRPSSLQTYKGGVRKDGILTALSLVNHTCGGIGRGDRCSEPVIDVYRCPNLKVVEHTIFTNTGASRPTRAPGHVQGTFGLEGFLEELANEIRMDPLELRRKNYSLKNEGNTGLPYSSKGLDKCYELGAKEIGWERRNTIPGSGKGKVRRGLGMASQIWWGAGSPGTLADIKLHRDGSVEVICGTQDIGTGTRTHMAVVAADTLGLAPQDITIKIGNSDYPWAPVSGGSLTTPSVAPAVRDAALKAADHLKELAASKLQTDASSIMLQDKKLFDKDHPEKAISFKETAGELRRETVFHGERKGLPEGFAYNTFGAHFAEVEVDIETGKIKVIKVVAAHEIGRVINRQTAETQIVGGVTQGISTALYEERVLDEEVGGVVNANLRDYKIATALDTPEIVPIIIDTFDPHINILGAKGLGEPPRIPASAAIANAVYNAIGVHIREIPMTPDKVLKAIQSKEVD